MDWLLDTDGVGGGSNSLMELVVETMCIVATYNCYKCMDGSVDTRQTTLS